MKKQVFTIATILTSFMTFCQIGIPPANNTAAQAGGAWYRGGNLYVFKLKWTFA